MKMLLIRHGECLKGIKDPSLTQRGKVQAEKLAKKLSTLPITKAYVSDLTRAFESFESYLAVNPSITYEKTEQVREIYRLIIGGPEKEGASQDREKKDKARADIFFDHITNSNLKGNVIIVTHGNLIRYFLSKAMKMDPKKAFDGLIVNCGSISVIEIKRGQTAVKSMNNVDHLGPKEVEQFYAEETDENYLS